MQNLERAGRCLRAARGPGAGGAGAVRVQQKAFRVQDWRVGGQQEHDVGSWLARVLKHQSAYFLSNAVGEIKRFLDELSRKLRTRFRTFSVLQLNVAHDLDQHWQQFELFAQ